MKVLTALFNKTALIFALFFLIPISFSFAGQTAVDLHQFSPPPGDTSVDFLQEVFGNIIGTIASHGNTATLKNDSVLGSMMFVFSGAVLFLGMLFIGYTTLKGTIDSAHDGELLGKKMSSFWVPLRTVFGTGFLLPFPSGYSLIQIAVMWVSLQGAGAADAIWKAAIEQISRDNMISRPMIPDSRPLAANILKYEVCAGAMNKQYSESGRATRIKVQSSQKTMTNTGEIMNYDVFDAIPVVSAVTTVKNFANATYTTTSYLWSATDGYINNEGVCGGLTWKQSWEASEGNSNTKAIKAPIMEAHSAAIARMIQELQPIADQIVAGQKPADGAIDRAANNYENTLRNAAKSAVSNTNDKARADFLQSAKDGGWIYAGTWYNHIVKMNDVMQSTLNGLPSSVPIAIADKENQYVLQNYKDALAVADEYSKNRVEGIRQVYFNETDLIGSDTSDHSTGMWETVKKGISAPFMGAINQMTQAIAGSNLNHMSQMKSFGDTLVVAGEVLMFSMSGLAGAAGGLTAKLSVGTVFDAGAALQFISGIVTTMVLMLFGFGVVLSTYVPMIPFITWMTSVVNWFVLVFESVIAGPLFAVAHTHPDGDDATGKAGQGYMMILSLFMRPSLMLFGLIGAMLLTQPVVGMINTAFMTVVSGIQADSMTGIVSFFGYVAIYVTVMTSVVHIVFSLIHWIPDNILRWVGAHAGGMNSAEGKGDQGHTIFAGGVREARMSAGGGMGKQEKPKTPGGNASPGDVVKSLSNDDIYGSDKY